MYGGGQAGLVALSTLPQHIITADSGTSKHAIHTYSLTCVHGLTHSMAHMHKPAITIHQISAHLIEILLQRC